MSRGRGRAGPGRAGRCCPDPRRAQRLRAARAPPPGGVVRGEIGSGPHDHPLPSGSACGLRIDERREDGRGARHVPRPPRRGSTVREDKKSRRILIFPPASQPADGCERPDSQGILVFPFRTTPRRSRRGLPSRRGRARLSEGDGDAGPILILPIRDMPPGRPAARRAVWPPAAPSTRPPCCAPCCRPARPTRSCCSTPSSSAFTAHGSPPTCHSSSRGATPPMGSGCGDGEVDGGGRAGVAAAGRAGLRRVAVSPRRALDIA